MKVTIGYIKAWRLAVFLAMVGGIILFGLVSTLATAILGGGAVANAVGVLALLVAIFLFLLVYADKLSLFEGEAEASLDNGKLHYKDKKREFDVPFEKIQLLKFDDVKTTEPGRILFAYKLVIKTKDKTYEIESDRAGGRKPEEVDLYRLYQALLEER